MRTHKKVKHFFNLKKFKGLNSVFRFKRQLDKNHRYQLIIL